MEILEIAVVYLAITVIFAVCLWAGMKLTGVDGTFAAMLIIAAITGLCDMVPGVGWILSPVVMFILICRWTDADFWPDAFLMVVVAQAVAFFGMIAVASYLLRV